MTLVSLTNHNLVVHLQNVLQPVQIQNPMLNIILFKGLLIIAIKMSTALRMKFMLMDLWTLDLMYTKTFSVIVKVSINT